MTRQRRDLLERVDAVAEVQRIKTEGDDAAATALVHGHG